MQATITLPRGYGHPSFVIGQRTKQGIITGIDIWTLDKFLACEEKNILPWTYMVQAREIQHLKNNSQLGTATIKGKSCMVRRGATRKSEIGV